jgi:2'-5' RNA ligase
MANTVAAIMAIPAPMEPIRLVGDEEKHATLLYFGETSTLPLEAKQTLLDAVELASGMLFPCGESVIDVARLGNEDPPALVALLSGECLTQIRNLFMMNPAVSGYRDNAEQHPGFTPHVTLSHPNFVDEAIQRTLMKQVYRVRFDRLSVWWNDERFDFPLGPAQDNVSMTDAIDRFVAQHALEDNDYFEHHGVKGQKWGVRKSKTNTGLQVRDHFELTGNKTPKSGDQFTHRGTIHTVLSAGKKPDGTHVVRSKPSSKVTPDQKALLKVQGKGMVKRAMGDKEFWQKAVAVGAVTGTGLTAAALGPALLPVGVLAAAGGAAHFSAVLSGSTLAAARLGNIVNAVNYRKRVRTARNTAIHSELKHADGLTVEEAYNSMSAKQKSAVATLVAAAVSGADVSEEIDLNDAWSSLSDDQRAAAYFIATVSDVDQEVSDQAAAHADEAVDKVLAHHGVKGQKWGVRRRVDPGSGLVLKSKHDVRTNLKTGIVKVTGGSRKERKALQEHLNDGGQLDLVSGKKGLQPRVGSADQIAQDRIQKKIDTVGVHALSTAELQSYSRRLQVEKDVNRVLAEQSAAEKAAAQSFITKFVKQQAGRQTSRIVDKAADIAVEKALESAGLNLSKKNKAQGEFLTEISSRIKPKKKGK